MQRTLNSHPGPTHPMVCSQGKAAGRRGEYVANVNVMKTDVKKDSGQRHCRWHILPSLARWEEGRTCVAYPNVKLSWETLCAGETLGSDARPTQL